jgi:hypothetical protein
VTDLGEKLLNEIDCKEFFDAIEDPCDKVHSLVDLIDRCKLLAAKYESKAAEYSESAELWEQRLQTIQEYGIWLLNETKTKRLESDEYILSMDKQLPEIKSCLTRRYSTEYMIPDELKFSIPESYREPKIIWEMRIEDVKNALLSGKKLNFAKLCDKQRLLILNKSEEQNAN